MGHAREQVRQGLPDGLQARDQGRPRGARGEGHGKRAAMFFLTSSLTSSKFLANFERLVLGCIEAEFCK